MSVSDREFFIIEASQGQLTLSTRAIVLTGCLIARCLVLLSLPGFLLTVVRAWRLSRIERKPEIDGYSINKAFELLPAYLE